MREGDDLAKMPLELHPSGFNPGRWIVSTDAGVAGEFASEADASFYVAARKAAAAMRMGCEAVIDEGNWKVLYRFGPWRVRSFVHDDNNLQVTDSDGLTALAAAYDVLKGRG